MFFESTNGEKYLKGLCIYSKTVPPKIHDLIAIASLLERVFPDIKEIKKEITLLNKYYIVTRYPADIPEFTLKQAKEAFRAAQKIKKFVIDKI